MAQVRVDVQVMIQAAAPGEVLGPIEAIAERAGAPYGDVLEQLSIFELRGEIERSCPGVYVRALKAPLHSLALVVSQAHMCGKREHSFWQRLRAMVAEEASRRGWKLTLVTVPLDHTETTGLIRLGSSRLHLGLENGVFSGVFLLGLDQGVDAYVRSTGWPSVSMVGRGNDRFLLDHASLLRMACRRMRELNLARPAVMARAFDLGPAGSEASLSGFSWSHSATADSIQDGWNQALNWMTHAEGRPDGVLILDEEPADGFLRALRRLGLRPGIDVAVIARTFKDLPICLGWEPEVERIGFDLPLLAERMADQMEALIVQTSPFETDEHLVAPEWLKPEAPAI